MTALPDKFAIWLQSEVTIIWERKKFKSLPIYKNNQRAGGALTHSQHTSSLRKGPYLVHFVSSGPGRKSIWGEVINK